MRIPEPIMRHILVLALLSATAVSAQAPAVPAPVPQAPTAPLLAPEEAVRLGVEHNYSLSIARDQASIAVNNRKAGIGPFLPEVSASARHGGIIGESGTSTSLGVSGSLLIFDGFSSYHSYQGLKAREEGARLQERLALENTVEGILSGYYAIAQQKLRLEAIRELLAVSEERARLAQARMEVGAGSRLEQLQALSDLNADSASYLSQLTALREAKVRLNQLLARDPGLDFEVVDTIPLEADVPAEAWRSALGGSNTAIRLARTDRRSAESGLKQARGGYWPNLNAGLGYSTTPGAIAGDEDLRDDGVSYSVSLSVPLFDRLRTRRDVGNARLGLRQSETRLKQQESETLGEFEQALGRHTSGIRQVTLEERNLEVSKLQAEAARERYRLGASSPLEFRDAQTRLLDSQVRLASARQETKAAELALKRLSGALVKDVPAAAAQ